MKKRKKAPIIGKITVVPEGFEPLLIRKALLNIKLPVMPKFQPEKELQKCKYRPVALFKIKVKDLVWVLQKTGKATEADWYKKNVKQENLFLGTEEVDIISGFYKVKATIGTPGLNGRTAIELFDSLKKATAFKTAAFMYAKSLKEKMCSVSVFNKLGKFLYCHATEEACLW